MKSNVRSYLKFMTQANHFYIVLILLSIHVQISNCTQTDYFGVFDVDFLKVFKIRT